MLLVADLFLFCYERDFMKYLSSDNQADVIKVFNSTSRYLDDLFSIDNPYLEGIINHIYPSELQLNKANTSDTETPFLDLHLSISKGFVSSKIYDKRDDFDFDIVNLPFLSCVHMTKICAYANFAYMFCIYANFAYVSKSIFYFAFTWLLRINRICRKLKYYSIKVIGISLNSGHA